MQTETPADQPRRPTAADWALCVLVVLVSAVPYLFDSGTGRGQLANAELLLPFAMVVPLAWRRSHPVAVFAVVTLATLAQVPLFEGPMLSDIGLMFALHAVIVWTPGFRWYITALVICVIGAGVAAWDWTETMPDGSSDVTSRLNYVIACLLCIAAAAALGQAARRRRQLMQQLHARALDAERDRDQQAQIAAQSERTRIAREMHDVVAHALAVIVVQSDGAAYAVRNTDNPQVAAAALDTIGATSREALAETRRLVGVLRQDGDVPELAPAVGPDDVEVLVTRVRSAGLRADLEGTEHLSDLPREVIAAVHRVIQEGLTNVIKHAGTDPRAEVRITRAATALVVTVTDDGAGGAASPSDGAGHGLLGMRERVAVLGGTLEAGPRTGSGFLLRSRIPLLDNETAPQEQP
ncbi:sensor histidine kinase [Dermacoccaceae bacterium W4C1]